MNLNKIHISALLQNKKNSVYFVTIRSTVEEAVAEMAAKYLPSLNEDEEELSDHEYDDADDNTSSFDANSALVLDSDTIQNVSESWELLRRIPDYEEKAGTILFSV